MSLTLNEGHIVSDELIFSHTCQLIRMKLGIVLNPLVPLQSEDFIVKGISIWMFVLWTSVL